MIIESDYSRDSVERFKNKTSSYFKSINGMDTRDIEDTVWMYINDVLEENCVLAEIDNIAIYGSRCRGMEHEDSDLDIVVEFSTVEREDYLFNLLHEEDMYIGNVKVDINPITRYETGYIGDYLEQAEQYLQEKLDSVGNENRQDNLCLTARRRGGR